MGFGDLLLIGIGLSMDAFAVAIGRGLSLQKVKPQQALTVGLYFGGFQALMPLIGYFLGSRFENLIRSFDHWCVFGLLAVIGINMIRESFGDFEKAGRSEDHQQLIVLALATSIDALAAGIGFGAMGINIGMAISVIGIITFVLSTIGVWLGHALGHKYQSRAEFVGGLVLIGIGIKTLLEHLNVI